MDKDSVCGCHDMTAALPARRLYGGTNRIGFFRRMSWSSRSQAAVPRLNHPKRTRQKITTYYFLHHDYSTGQMKSRKTCSTQKQQDEGPHTRNSRPSFPPQDKTTAHSTQNQQAPSFSGRMGKSKTSPLHTT
ncbi:unnamed protein product [Ectocarpus fasciculatus]